MFKTRSFFLFVLLITLLTGTACSTAYEYQGSRLDPPLVVPDFELTSDDAQPFRLSEDGGDITLVYFGYTFCPDVCPLTLADVKQALAELDPADQQRVRVLFISVDPERDTPEVLDRYMTAFDPAFVGLTGDASQIEPVVRSFGAFAQTETVADASVGYLVSHSARLYLLNADQEILLTYPFEFEPEGLASDLTYLLNEEA